MAKVMAQRSTRDRRKLADWLKDQLDDRTFGPKLSCPTDDGIPDECRKVSNLKDLKALRGQKLYILRSRILEQIELCQMPHEARQLQDKRQIVELELKGELNAISRKLGLPTHKTVTIFANWDLAVVSD